MITRFNKPQEGDYYNFLQLVVLFISTEVLEILTFFKAYDPVSGIYKPRKIFWLAVITSAIIGAGLLIMITCVTFLSLIIAGVV